MTQEQSIRSIVTARVVAEKYLISKTNEAQSQASKDSIIMGWPMAVLIVIVLFVITAENNRLELRKIEWKKFLIIVLIGVAFAIVFQSHSYRLALSSKLAVEGFKTSLEYGQAKDDYYITTKYPEILTTDQSGD